MIPFKIVFSPPPFACQISFESRLDAHDIGKDCLMLIDGMDFRINHQGPVVRGDIFGSHKYAGKSALRYELGIDILVGNLCLGWRTLPRQCLAGHKDV